MTFHDTTAPVGTVSPRALREWLVDGEEIALVDVREEGQFGRASCRERVCDSV